MSNPDLQPRALLDQLSLGQSVDSWVETGGDSEADSDSRNGGSELTLTDTDTESVPLSLSLTHVPTRIYPQQLISTKMWV